MQRQVLSNGAASQVDSGRARRLRALKDFIPTALAADLWGIPVIGGV